MQITIVMGGMPEMPGTPREELTKAFGKVSTAVYDLGDKGIFGGRVRGIVYASSIPNLYNIVSALPAKEQMARVKKGLQPLSGIEPLQGLGRTEEDSIECLYREAAEKGMSGSLRLLATKDGQQDPPVVIGKGYEAVRNNDPRHDHDSPDLVNFITVHFDPFLGFVKGSLDSAHSHLWLK